MEALTFNIESNWNLISDLLTEPASIIILNQTELDRFYGPNSNWAKVIEQFLADLQSLKLNSMINLFKSHHIKLYLEIYDEFNIDRILWRMPDRQTFAISGN